MTQIIQEKFEVIPSHVPSKRNDIKYMLLDISKEYSLSTAIKYNSYELYDNIVIYFLQIRKKRNDLKVIVSSATLDAEVKTQHCLYLTK